MVDGVQQLLANMFQPIIVDDLPAFTVGHVKHVNHLIDISTDFGYADLQAEIVNLLGDGVQQADAIVRDAQAVLGQSLPELEEIEIELVWDPPWTPAMMSDEARAFFGWEG